MKNKAKQIKTHFKGRYGDFYAPLLPAPLKFGNGNAQHMTLCPFHDDRNPSLSINVEDGLWNCFAGCDGGDVFDFYAKLKGLDPKIDFPTIVDQIAKEHSIDIDHGNSSVTQRPRKQIKIHYNYRDADSNIVFRVVRKEPGRNGAKKDFSQCHPDPSGSGWIWDMKGVSRVLYNLPAVIKASVVFFVEGEKAADALAKLDFTVTTSPGGAKKVPSLQEKDQILDTLQKKIVIIWPDNDPAGHKHAQQVAKLLHGKADAVFIIEPTGQPEKGDAYDFIEEHGPEEAEKRINELCNKAELWEPSSAESQEEDGSAKANEPSSITKVIDGGLVTTHYNSASTHHQAEDPEPVEQEETETNHPALDFPTEIMGGVAGDFAELYSQYLEVPIHFLYIGFLACLGSFLANTLTLATELETQPRLYILLLGASADDRKSTAIKKVVDFFKDTMQDFMVCWGVGSAEGLQKLFVKNPNLLLALDEFKSFVSKCKIDASVLLPMVTTLFESNNYEAHTKQKSIVLEQVNLSILAASTIETYEHTWDTSFTDIGFNNRTFIVPGSGKRMFSFPKKVPANEKVSLQRGLRDILRFVGSERELDITPAGFNIYDKWYINQDRSVHTKRLDGYALRFMSLLAANESKPEIDEDIVRKAIKLVDWQLEVRRHHDPIDADNVQAKMEEKIRRVLSTKGPQTNRGLKQLTNANRAGLWIYNNAKDNLRRENDILLNKETKRWETGPGQPNVKP